MRVRRMTSAMRTSSDHEYLHALPDQRWLVAGLVGLFTGSCSLGCGAVGDLHAVGADLDSEIDLVSGTAGVSGGLAIASGAIDRIVHHADIISLQA